MHESKLSKIVINLLNIYPTKLDKFTIKSFVDGSFLENLICVQNKQLSWYYFFIYDCFQHVDKKKKQNLGTI